MAGSQPNPPQRNFAESVVAELRAAGHEALFAGGCVRDELLGRRPKDFDVATSALPDQVREVFGKRRTIAVGAAFGVITVLPPRGTSPKEAGQIEVATFRADAGYSDGRRPDGVTFTDASHDAARRDFTINGLFYDPDKGEVVDYVDGRFDLKAKIVRAIGDPEQRFDEDKLRMLRAVRFAATLGFTLEPETADAVRRHAEELAVVSAERIGAEVRHMLVDASRGRAVELLADTRLLPVVFPELTADLEQVVGHLVRLVDPPLALALACLLLGSVDGEGGGEAARRLRLTKREGAHTAWLLDNAGRVSGAANARWSTLQPLLSHEHGADLVTLHEAVGGGPDADSRFCREKLAQPRSVLDPPPLVVGRDLIEHGARPCPEFDEWLAAARAAQLDGEVATKDEAFALVDRLRQ